MAGGTPGAPRGRGGSHPHRALECPKGRIRIGIERRVTARSALDLHSPEVCTSEQVQKWPRRMLVPDFLFLGRADYWSPVTAGHVAPGISIPASNARRHPTPALARRAPGTSRLRFLKVSEDGRCVLRPYRGCRWGVGRRLRVGFHWLELPMLPVQQFLEFALLVPLSRVRAVARI